jgi:hypothetical protein
VSLYHVSTFCGLCNHGILNRNTFFLRFYIVSCQLNIICHVANFLWLVEIVYACKAKGRPRLKAGAVGGDLKKQNSGVRSGAKRKKTTDFRKE